MPNSFQNEASMSVDEGSLPEPEPARLLLPFGDRELCSDADERDEREDRAPPPWTDSRLALGLLNESRLRTAAAGAPGDDDIPRVSVPLIPSSPTVACRISSRKVQSPSRRSEAICFPVRMSASRDGGGIELRHCGGMSSAATAVAGLGMVSGVRNGGSVVLRSTEGRVAARGTLPMRSLSGLAWSSESGLREAESEAAERRDSVRACEPWNTLRPFTDTVLPAGAGAAVERTLWRRSRSRLCRAELELPGVSGGAAMLWGRRWWPGSSGDLRGSRGSAWRLISVRLRVFSDDVHCFLRATRSDSACCSSSRSSSTFRSCEAIALSRPFPSSCSSKEALPVSGGRAGDCDWRADEWVMGVMEPGDDTSGSGGLIGKFKVSRLEWRAPLGRELLAGLGGEAGLGAMVGLLPLFGGESSMASRKGNL